MSKVYQAVSECAPSSEGSNAYVYSITPTFGNSLTALTSANELLVLDRLNLSSTPILRLRDVPKPVSCLVPGDETGRTVLCSGGDGVVGTFDVRSQARVSVFSIDRAITALTCQGDSIAIGTELAHHQAIVSVWDRRQNQRLWQNSENNDDITAVDFHPHSANILLSGGDDGQVSIFDVNVPEEDDSLLQGVNHGPIHKAGFLGDHRFFALSSDQNLSIHPLSSAGDEEDPAPTLLGDLRPKVPCEYVIDVFRSGDGFAIAAGSNNSDPRVEILELRHATNFQKSPRLRSESSYTLAGGHGEEVVRSIFADEETNVIYTAGEDGRVKAFQYSAALSESFVTTKSSRQQKKSTDNRYKPY